MKTIDVKDQPALSAARTLEICLNGIRYRLFRSLVTVVVIAVATAFVMNVLCEAISIRSVARATERRTVEQRLVALWTAHLSAAGTPEGLLREVAGLEPGSSALQEVGQMAGLSPAELADYHRSAQDAVAAMRFFEGLDYGKRRRLVRARSGVAILELLQDPEEWQRFEGALKEMKSVRLPGAPGAFRALVGKWPALRGQTEKLQAGRAAAVARVEKALAGRPLADALAQADGPFGEQVRQAGFTSFDAATARVVTARSKQLREMKLLDAGIEAPDLRKRVSAELDILPADLSTSRLWDMLLSRKSAEWYLAQMKQAKLESDSLAPDRVVSLAKAKADEAALVNAARLTGGDEGGFLGIGSRMAWLVLVSLLVCVVGIMNAMLMTVTERFREIATLKCLGALDGFIMLLFLMEASLLGVVGGLLGGLAGSAIGFGRMLAAFGGILTGAFPTGPWLVTLALATLVGVVLAGIAGVYPSYVAARLAPMEAMRIE